MSAVVDLIQAKREAEALNEMMQEHRVAIMGAIVYTTLQGPFEEDKIKKAAEIAYKLDLACHSEKYKMHR